MEPTTEQKLAIANATIAMLMKENEELVAMCESLILSKSGLRSRMKTLFDTVANITKSETILSEEV